MAKKKKKDHADIVPVPREAIAGVTCEEDFVELLRRELEWPIPLTVQRLADVAIPHDLQKDFGFRPEENRIAVSRLLNLTEDQPWGVFLFEFKTKRPYLSHLRRLLRILGSQRTLRKGDPIWDRSDLLFICTPDWHQFQFVHFSGEKPESAVISTFGWKGPDDPFLHTLCRHNLPRLRMPKPLADGDYESDAWRTAWRDVFSVKPVTDEFYTTLKEVFDAVQSGVKGLKGEDCRFFAELVVNRMVFLKFVEKKGWLDNDRDYLFNRFQAHGRKNFWQNFLCDFFFEGLCKEKTQRSKAVNELLGDVPFLNAELFAPSDKWDDWAVKIENRVFDLLFDKLLNPYNFTVCETSPLEVEVAFNQDLLGYGYEELIADQHGQGAYYTHPTEVNLMCRESLRAYLEGRCPKMDKELIGKLVYSELTTDDSVCETDALELYQALHDVTVVDPALGSGTFPVAMMKHLFLALRTLGEYLKDSKNFAELLDQDGITDPEDAFALKLHIIERSIYGCDVDYFAVQIAKLRFWIELMVDCDQPEALPNFNCKLVVGDALVSVVGTDNEGNLITLEDLLGHPTRLVGQGNILHFIGKQVVERLAELKRKYFKVKDARERKAIEDKIFKTRDELLRSVGVSPEKIKRTDKHILWQIDFAEIFTGECPGFDIAIANPPYLRHELIGSTFKKCGLEVEFDFFRTIFNTTYDVKLSGQCDLYVFFFIKSLALLKSNHGILCFICSNSWLDVDYGGALQVHIANTAKIRAIVDSKYSRSFAGADINTAITLFITCEKSVEARKAIANFILYRTPYEKGGSLPQPQKVERSTVFNTNCYRQFSIPQQSLLDDAQQESSKNAKWGSRYLRAPDIYFKLVNMTGNEFIRLNEIAKVGTYLNTGGADGFFFLKIIKLKKEYAEIESSDGSQIFTLPSSFLRPIIRSPRESKQALLTSESINWCIFVCNEPVQKLPEAVKHFIQWGESRKFNERSGCRNRSPWYRLPEQAQTGAPILIGRNHNQTHLIYYNPERIISNRFYRIEPQKGYPIESLVAYLNSTIGWLQKELLGRTNLGQGALDTQGTDLSRILVPNLAIATKIEKTAISVFRRYIKRNALPVRDEMCQHDREELDKCILDLIGWSKYRLEMCEAVVDLVETRMQKARSI